MNKLEIKLATLKRRKTLERIFFGRDVKINDEECTPNNIEITEAREWLDFIRSIPIEELVEIEYQPSVHTNPPIKKLRWKERK